MILVIRMKVKLGKKYLYPDQLSPEMLEYADKRINAHRKAWEYPDQGLGKPVAIWWNKKKVFCVEYITPDGYKHWFHYQWTGGNWQFDGFEWF